MNSENILLETYFNNNPDVMLKITYHLDSTGGWKNIVQELKKFRVSIFLRQDFIGAASSPSNFLINELIKRCCTLNDFKEILKRCNLLNALAFLGETEHPKIITQPGKDYEAVSVFFAEDLRLECVATGVPPPTYQWYCDNVPLIGQNSSVMILPNFREDNEGEYYCIVSQHGYDCEDDSDYIINVTSNIVVCSLLESLPEFIQNLPKLAVHKVDSELKLEVEIFCRSKYTIEWIKKNQILEGENSSTLMIKNIKVSDAGKYRCVVKNPAGEVFSDECQVVVIHESKRKKASAKVALLIANSKYENFMPLRTPVEDCLLLAEKLENLKFHVITLINLTLKEMHDYINWFFDNLPPKAYAFVCYIGHGFSINNNKFMMPVDCPRENEYHMSDCILDELLVKKSVESKLKLLVLVLDMCQKEPDRELSAVYQDRVPDYSYVPSSKFSKVQAFATSSHQSSYECPRMLNGFYIPHICKYLAREAPIIHVFELAHQEFLKNKVVELQKPSLSYNADLKFKLSDPTDGSIEIFEMLSKFRNIKENLQKEHELFFPKINLNTTLTATPHRGKILNAIDIKFTQTLLNKYTIISYASPEDLDYAWTMSNEDNDTLLTLFNIQKVKTNIFITINLLVNNEPYDSIINDIDLGLPLIASVNHWLEKKQPGS